MMLLIQSLSLALNLTRNGYFRLSTQWGSGFYLSVLPRTYIYVCGATSREREGWWSEYSLWPALPSFLCVWDRISSLQPHTTGLPALELPGTHLSQPPTPLWVWDYRCVLPHLALRACWGPELWSPCLPVKSFIFWVISLSHTRLFFLNIGCVGSNWVPPAYVESILTASPPSQPIDLPC